TSFVAFLIETHGADRFRRYVGASGNRTMDNAAEAVYGKPHAHLRREWLDRLTRPEQRLMGTAQLLRQYGALLRPYCMQTALLCTCLLTGVTWFARCPQIYRILINDGLANRNEHLVLVLISALFVTALVSFLGSLASGYVGAWLGTRVAR